MVQTPDRVVSTLDERLNVLEATAAAGRWEPGLPDDVSAILCRRTRILPVEHDQEVLAAGLPLLLIEDRDGSESRAAALELRDGRLQFEMLRGDLNEEETSEIQSLLNRMQDRLQEDTEPSGGS